MSDRKRRVLELTVEKVLLEIGTSRSRLRPQHILMASLVWPRPMIAERVAVKTLAFKERMADLSKSDWTTRILFKESVEGPFGVEVSVTEALNEQQVDAFIGFMGSTLLGVAGSKATAVIANPLLAGMVKVPLQQLSKQVASAGKKPASVVGVGSVDMDTGTWEPGQTMKLDVPLIAQEPIYQTQRGKTRGRGATRRRCVAKEGSRSGTVVLAAKVYG